MNYLRIYLPKFLSCLKERGLWMTAKETLRVVYRDISEWRFDHKWGIRTRGVKIYSRAYANSAYLHAQMYEATTPRAFRKIMGSIRHLPLPNTFIDMGSGKGRVLFMAAECGFRHIVGVELDPSLARISKENVKRSKDRQSNRTEIEVICQDAGTYEFPDEDAVIFLYHPFDDTVMRKVLEHLRDCPSRERYIIYLNPMCKSLFRNPDEFALVMNADSYSVYRMISIPATVSSSGLISSRT